MAERPLFVPSATGAQLVQTVPVRFPWHPGLSDSQKKKNVVELHSAGSKAGFWPILEVSSKSEFEAGRRLSAFSLKTDIEGVEIALECVFQGSKVFERGGPFRDLFAMEPRKAKRDIRLKESGRLIAFDLQGKRYPLSPPTAFYDWLYTSILYKHREWLKRLQEFAAFTDIEFNPDRSLNCQARSLATFVALESRERLDEAMTSYDAFVATAAVANV